MHTQSSPRARSLYAPLLARLLAGTLLLSIAVLQGWGGGSTPDSAATVVALESSAKPAARVAVEDGIPSLISTGRALEGDAAAEAANPLRASIMAPTGAPTDRVADPCGGCTFTGQKTSTVSLTARSYIAPVGSNVGTWAPPSDPLKGRALAALTDLGFSETPSSFPGRFTTHMQVAITCGGAGGNTVLSAVQTSLVRHDGTEPAKPNPNVPIFLNPTGMVTRGTLTSDASKVTAWFSSKGRPPTITELAFQMVKPRASRDIWHEAVGEWECRCGEPRLKRFDQGYSFFPSHVFFASDAFSPQPSGYSRVINQGPFSNLWDLHPLGVQLVLGTTSLQPFALPAPGFVRLSAATSGPGLVNSLAPLNCGAQCQADVPRCTNQTVNAVPGAGAFLKAWGGDCQGSAAQCTLNMNRSKHVTAAFANGKQLFVNVVGGGTVQSTPTGINACSGSCQAWFDTNAMVTLNANPGFGWVFGNWSGDCAAAGTSRTCVVSMSAARNVTATFKSAITGRAVTVNVTGSGSVSSSPAGISACKSSCTAQFPTSTAVSLTATAAAGSNLIGWSGGCTPSPTNRAVCVVPAGAAASTVSATFGPTSPPPPRPVF